MNQKDKNHEVVKGLADLLRKSSCQDRRHVVMRAGSLRQSAGKKLTVTVSGVLLCFSLLNVVWLQTPQTAWAGEAVISQESDEGSSPATVLESDEGSSPAIDQESHIDVSQTAGQESDEGSSPAAGQESNTDSSPADSQETLPKLKKPCLKKPVRTENSLVKLSWKKVKAATVYKVYRAKQKDGTYHLLASTSKCSYKDAKGTPGKTYYYKVRAVYKSNSGQTVKSPYSKTVSAKVRVKPKRIAYVGDSIMRGFSEYGVIRNTASHKVFAKVGIQTYAFLGSEYMSGLLYYNPDRIYISLGINAVGRRLEPAYYDSVVSSYKKILDKCIARNKNVEIIIIPVTACSRNASVSQTCRKAMNARIKKMVQTYYGSNPNIRYWNVDDLLTDDSGYLRREYQAGDGIHWQIPCYKMMYREFIKYGKEW